MHRLSGLRQRLNRNADGSWRGHNRRLGVLEIAGLLLLVAGLVAWLLHAKFGVQGGWSYVVMAVGALLAWAGQRRVPERAADPPQAPDYAGVGSRIFQGVMGIALAGTGLYALLDTRSETPATVLAVVFVVLGGNALWAAWHGRRSWLVAVGALF
ncbi:MAG: hypothetical protein KJZ98_12295 [Burkholderiaceae bacterium]|jgi:hypothetical protein|nr:hypothetical protein [Burkholderiaceae bacterium]MEB2352281.1 hypothetical protein [Burkholderiaceae bacterium]